MYDEIARSYNWLHGAEQRRKLERLLPRLEAGSVLDVGCGTAHLAPYFADYTGVDPSKALLDEALPGVRTVCARGEELPFPDASFDIALSLTALHNYDDPERGVDELFRVARRLIAVGVLKKSPHHDAIVERLKASGTLVWQGEDPHDTLLVLRKA